MTQERQARNARPRLTYRTVQVTRVQRLTPGLVRVTLSGPEMDGFEIKGPAEHLRLWYPQAGQERPVLPAWTDSGLVMPAGQERPVSRVYTPRGYNPSTRELDVDIVLHPGSEGPGLRWANAAAPGQYVAITGPGRPYRVDGTAGSFVLAADHTGLPALATVLEALPASATAQAYVEVADAGEELALDSPARLSVTWLHANHEAARPGAALIAGLSAAALPPDVRVFVACEADAMREIRKHLLYGWGLPREHVHTHGYWKYGVANHPDHDLGQDV